MLKKKKKAGFKKGDVVFVITASRKYKSSDLKIERATIVGVRKDIIEFPYYWSKSEFVFKKFQELLDYSKAENEKKPEKKEMLLNYAKGICKQVEKEIAQI